MTESFKHKIRTALSRWELAVAGNAPGFYSFVRLNQKSLEGLTDVLMPAIEECIALALEAQKQSSGRGVKVARRVANAEAGDRAPAPAPSLEA